MTTLAFTKPFVSKLAVPLTLHKRRIAKYALVGSLIAGCYGLWTPHDYLATSSVLITPKGYSSAANQALIEGQIRLMTSDQLLGQLIDREKLTSDKEFGLKQEPLYQSILNALAQHKTLTTKERALLALNSAVKIKQSDNFTLDIAVSSLEPGKAMRLSNSLSQLYLEGQFGIGQSNNRAYVARVTSRLDELTKSLRLAEENLYKLKAASRSGENDGDLTFQANQLAISRAKTAELREKLDKYVRFQRSGGDVSLMMQVFNSPALETLRQQAIELQKQENDLQQTLGPRHPQIVSTQKQLNDAKISLSQEVTRLGNGLKAEVENAIANEKTLTSKVEGLRNVASGLSVNGQALRDAEREVETQKALYTSLLMRSGESRENAEPIQASLISEAHMPFAPQGLPLSLLAGLGLLVGGFMGLIRSFLPFIGKKRVISAPMLGLSELNARAPLAKITAFINVQDERNYANFILAQATQVLKNGQTVLVIEADSALPLSQLILTHPQAGLCEWVRGENTLEEVLVYDRTTGLSFLPLGQGNLQGKLEKMYVSRLKLFQNIIIASGNGDNLAVFTPMMPVNTLIVEKGKTLLSAALRKKDELHAKDLQLENVIFI